MKISYCLICFPVLLLFACHNAKPKEQPAEKEKTYRIAYNVNAADSLHPGNYEVLMINMDGSGRKSISNDPEDVAWTYHAAGSRLFFISDRDTCYRCYFLYATDDEGKSLKKVSDLQLEDSWMSSRNEGKELVVSGRKGNELRYQLFLVNAETGQYSQLTTDTGAMYYDPVFSPDGKKIAFAYIPFKRDRSLHEELYLMNVDGTDMIQLTHFPENDSAIHTHEYKAGPPRWNAQENFISYNSFQAGKSSLYAVTPDGKKQWKLTDNKESEGWHSWSSDGKWLAFDIVNEKRQYHIGLMNWKTKEIKIITDTTYRYQQAPVFVEIH